MHAPVWNDSLSVLFDSVDSDHRQLIEAMNDLFVACYIGQPPEEIRAFIDRIIEATRRHFIREEALMRRIGHEDLEGHRAEHQTLLREIGDIRNAYVERLEPERARAFLDHLRNWLMIHIETRDKQIAGFASPESAG